MSEFGNADKTELLCNNSTKCDGTISPIAKTFDIETTGVTLPVDDLGELPQKIASTENGRYDIVQEIGRGGMGQIQLWKDLNIQRLVATKMLLPEKQKSSHTLQRFFEEGQITGQLEHPNIVPIHEMGVNQGNPYFTMKYVKGESLKQLLYNIANDPQQTKFWTLGKMFRVFQGICNAIEYAHSKNVIHRDLKPENIMIGNFGQVMVMDWGLAKVLGQGQEVISKEDSITTLREQGGFSTITGQIAGTPLYMSPEQAGGEIDKIDQRSDIYALGTILYEMVTGKHTVAGGTVIEILGKVSQGRREPIPSQGIFGKIPKELRCIIDKCLEVVPENRYQTVTQLSEDIQRFLDHRQVLACEYNSWDKLRNFAARYRRELTLVIGTVALLSCVFAIWNHYTNKFQSEERIRLAQETLNSEQFSDDLTSLRQLAGLPEEEMPAVEEHYGEGEAKTNRRFSADKKPLANSQPKATNTNAGLANNSGSTSNTGSNSAGLTNDAGSTGDFVSDDMPTQSNELSDVSEKPKENNAALDRKNKPKKQEQNSQGGKENFQDEKENSRDEEQKTVAQEQDSQDEKEDPKQQNPRKKFEHIKNAVLKSTKHCRQAYEKHKTYEYRVLEAQAWLKLYLAAKYVNESNWQEIARFQIENLLKPEDYKKYEPQLR